MHPCLIYGDLPYKAFKRFLDMKSRQLNNSLPYNKDNKLTSTAKKHTASDILSSPLGLHAYVSVPFIQRDVFDSKALHARPCRHWIKWMNACHAVAYMYAICNFCPQKHACKFNSYKHVKFCVVKFLHNHEIVWFACKNVQIGKGRIVCITNHFKTE